MPTPTTDYTFDLTAALTPVFGSNAAAIEQAITTAYANGYRGMVIASETTPATTGQPSGYPTNWYTWHQRCLWLKPSTGEIFRFNGTTWAAAKATPAASTITASMIVDKTITLAKLNPDGLAYQIAHIAADGLSVEWVNPNSIFAAGSLGVDKLVGGGTGVRYLKSSGGSVAWTVLDSAELITLFNDGGQWPLTMIESGAADLVLAMNSGGTALTYRSLTGLISDYTIALSKLAKDTASAGKYLRYDPTTGALSAVTLNVPTAPSFTKVTVEDTTLPTIGSARSVAHGLAGTPQTVTGVLVCVTADAGYSIGDVVDLTALHSDDGTSSFDYANPFSLSYGATNVTLTCKSDATVMRVTHKTTGGSTTFTPANWKFRATCLYFP